MVDTVAALEMTGVPYWADYGTLLGAVRNPLTTWADYSWLPPSQHPEGPLAPGIIPHDKDADFGFLATQWGRLKRAAIELEAKGYSLRVNPLKFKMKVRLSRLNRTSLDLFGWHERSNGVMYRLAYLGVDQYKGRDFPRTLLYPIGTVEWEGLQLAAPRDPVAFCAMRYGPHWKTPIPANNDGVRR